jgi:protein tyrosine phosphatase (PTP) superfamily phosphohydrolase (DUF442 family)
MERDPDDIACWQRIDARLTTSGRLTIHDLDCLAGLGISRVINLALADSPGILPDEPEQLAARHIAYSHIPVPFDAPAQAHFDAFCTAMGTSERERVHVHCVMNWRVSAFVYRWHRERRGMGEAAARALLERQWTPETNDHKDAPAWARFIAGAQNRSD